MNHVEGKAKGVDVDVGQCRPTSSAAAVRCHHMDTAVAAMVIIHIP